MLIKIDDVFEIEFYLRLKKKFSIFTRLKWFHGDKSPYYNKKIKCRESIVSLVNWKIKTVSYDVDYTQTFFLEYHGFYEAFGEMISKYGDEFENLNETFIVSELMKKTNYQIPVDIVRDRIFFL